MCGTPSMWSNIKGSWMMERKFMWLVVRFMMLVLKVAQQESRWGHLAEDALFDDLKKFKEELED